MKHKDYKGSAHAVNTTYCWNITRKGNFLKKSKFGEVYTFLIILKIVYNPLLFQPACSLKVDKNVDIDFVLIVTSICNLKGIIII